MIRRASSLLRFSPMSRCCSSGSFQHGRNGKHNPVENVQMLKVIGMSVSLEVLFGATCVFGLAYYCLGSTSMESATSAIEEEKMKEAWRKQLAELKQYYADQSSAEKQDPPAGSDLARFAMSNRRLYAMHFGLPRWKIQELEAVEGWQWEWKIKR
eukprot:TRINITY_DN29426_c0_g1_i1.p1 TRINITY_DN29426_c0_g1~~TRINITY_DN29426_c0_g1_i1.p1  ORF type:complete len:155 (+),score=23.42 TRINITY_DN29426_c0_g1_i1:75-539(+)